MNTNDVLTKLIAEIKEKITEIEKEPAPEDGVTLLLQKCKINAFREVLSAVSRLKKNSLQQEQPRSKFVKVRCVFPFDETWEKDKIYTCEVWHHGDLNRNFWDVYYDYGKDPKYVQFTTIESLNEEFAIIKDESQVMPEQPEVDL